MTATPGIDAMRRGLADWRAVGSELGTTYFLALMAEAYRDAGRLDEAWVSLDAAREVEERTGEGWWASEIRRLRGELLRLRGAPLDESRDELAAALELARSRSARSLELRAEASLADLRASA